MLEMLLGFFLLILKPIYRAYRFIVLAVARMSLPFTWIPKKIAKFFEDHTSEKLNRRFSAFNGFWPFVLFVILLGLAVWFVLRYISQALPVQEHLDHFISSSAFGASLNMQSISEVPLSSMIAIACGGLFFSLFWKTLEDARLYVRIPCFILYWFVSVSLVLLLIEPFTAFSNWLYDTWMVIEAEGMDFVKFLGMLPLFYLFFFLYFVTLKEYAARVGVFIIGMPLQILLTKLADWMATSTSLPEKLLALLPQIFTICLVLGLEAIRVVVGAKIEKLME